jgi:hypothetical protein
LGETDTSAIDLAFAGRSLKLPDELRYLGGPGRSARMTTRQEPPRRIDRKPPAKRGLAGAQQGNPLTGRNETDLIEAYQFGHGRRFVYLGEIYILGSDARLLIGAARSTAETRW